MLASGIAVHSIRQLQQYWHVTQVDEEAVQKALGELEEGWREFEDGVKAGLECPARLLQSKLSTLLR